METFLFRCEGAVCVLLASCCISEQCVLGSLKFVSVSGGCKR